MNISLRRSTAILLILCMLAGSLGLVACSQKATPMATLDDYVISTNVYQFLLSRVKGTLSRAGYSVASADFWETVVDSNGTTYDEYFRQAVLVDARRYLAAMVLFDELKLVLPQSQYDKIDEDIQESITTAGSKSALNSELATFGVNIDMLREIYIMEAKFNYLQDHLYGANGSKIAANVRQEYLDRNAVCYRYVLIRGFDYVYETDSNGDDIYFLPNENNAKVNNIAYDNKAGEVRLDANNKIIVDKNGDSVYFLPSGRIAYDTEAGVRAIVYDEQGIAKTVRYSADRLAELKGVGEEIVASVEPGDYAAFEAFLAEYELDKDDEFVVEENFETTYSFLYTTGDNGFDYLNDIADTLASIHEGEVRLVSASDYGYNVIMKYPMPSDAATNSTYEGYFTDLADRVIAELFQKKCEANMEKVTVDEKAFAGLPSMKDVGTNLYY